MTAYAFTIRSQFSETGDDIYVKPLSGDFSGSNWPDDSIAGIEQLALNRYSLTLDSDEEYAVYLNSHSQAFTADAGTDVITANSHGLANGQTLRFKGTDLPAPLVQTTLYYVRDVTTHTFKVEAAPAAGALNLTDAGSGTMTFTSPSKRSIADEPDIGIIPAVAAVALTGEGESGVTAATVLAMTNDVTWTLTREAAIAAAAQTTAAAIRTAQGLAAANLDTQLGAVKAKTDLLGTVRSLIRW